MSICDFPAQTAPASASARADAYPLPLTIERHLSLGHVSWDSTAATISRRPITCRNVGNVGAILGNTKRSWRNSQR